MQYFKILDYGEIKYAIQISKNKRAAKMCGPITRRKTTLINHHIFYMLNKKTQNINIG